MNYWTGKQVQPGRSAWSFSNAKPRYVKATPVIEIGDVECLGMHVDDVEFPAVNEPFENEGFSLNRTINSKIIDFGEGKITPIGKNIHSLNRAIERGFTPEKILNIIRNGEQSFIDAPRGLQQIFNLNGNKVILDPLKGKVITVFGPGKDGSYLK